MLSLSFWQNWSTEACPDVTKSLRDVWILLFWPIVVVGVGFLVGYGAATISGTPRSQFRSVLAACGFGNSTGLPITLLTVVHANFPATSDLGHIDPTLFLSVYLLLYPVLQWGIGGWLLAPDDEDDDDDIPSLTYSKRRRDPKESQVQNEDNNDNGNGNNDDDNNYETIADDKAYNFSKNVLNNKAKERWYKHSRNAMGETDASLYISDADLVGMAAQYYTNGSRLPPPPPNESEESEDGNGQPYHPSSQHFSSPLSPIIDEDRKSVNLTSTGEGPLSPEIVSLNDPSTLDERTGLLTSSRRSHRESTRSIATQCEGESLWETCEKVMSRCFQPPVVGALAGIAVAATPLRGTFVDVIDRGSHAPLQFFFDGLYAVGAAAVPINMMILGCNLSASYNSQMQKTPPENALQGVGLHAPSNLLSKKTLIAIVVGKMLIMPLIGICLALFLEHFVLDIPDGTLELGAWMMSKILYSVLLVAV